MGKILIVEPIAESGIEMLRAAGHTVDVQLGLSHGDLLKALESADALIVRSGTEVTAEYLKAGERLKVVGRAGVGIDNVDITTATELGIMVVNTPEANILSAAEHTMGLILAQARNIPQAHNDLKAGKWERVQYSGVELSDKVLGIVGLGRVGQLVAHRAKAFGMEIKAYDPYVSVERAQRMGVELLELKELVGVSDFLTLHVVTTPETKEMINAEILAAAKPGLQLINVSRGEAINDAALADAIRSGQVKGAALDVFTTEPPQDIELLTLPEVVATPHLGASTLEAQERVGTTVAEQVMMALAGEFPPFVVNVSAQVVPEILRPFLPLCEKIGQIFAALEGSGKVIPSVVDVEFQGEIGTIDTEAGTLAILTGMQQKISAQPVSYVNAKALAEARGLKVSEHHIVAGQDYVNQIMVSGGGHIVGGTVVGLNNDPLIIRIDEHKVALPPSDHMILLENDDQPGVIGFLGEVLGNAGLNIDNMHVGRSERGAALMVISTNKSAGESVKKELEDGDGINSVCLIDI